VRVRTTEPPTALLTTRPPWPGRPAGRPDRRAREQRARGAAPARTTSAKSAEACRRAGRGSTVADGVSGVPGPRGGRAQADSSVRPLRRRAGQDGAAGAGAHAQPEAVRLAPTAVVRLEGALAHDGGSIRQDGRADGCGADRPSERSAVGRPPGRTSAPCRLADVGTDDLQGTDGSEPGQTGRLRHAAHRLWPQPDLGVTPGMWTTPCTGPDDPVSVRAAGLPRPRPATHSGRRFSAARTSTAVPAILSPQVVD
jgi:hypothetical protein